MKTSVFFCISLIVHLTLVLLSSILPNYRTPENLPVEIQIVPNKNPKLTNTLPKQIVRETPIPDSLKIDTNDDPTKFLSAQTQRVKKQTKAPTNGMTKNRSPEKNNTASKNKPSDFRRFGGLGVYAPKYKNLSTLARNYELDKGLSAVGEILPKEVSVGTFTSLNTDRYLYYSFFSRVEDLIRFRWESMVKQTIDSTPVTEFRRTSINKWNTYLEIWLKSNGEFHSAHLMKEAGIKGFDRAAIQSFVQARIFPNPPKEMLENDGLIHLKYAFQVHFDPRLVARP